MAAASVVSPPPSTSAKDSAAPPLLLGVGAGIDGPAVAPAAAPRSQVAGHEPPTPKAWWAEQSCRVGGTGSPAGRCGPGGTRPLASRPGEVERGLRDAVGRTPSPGLCTGRRSSLSQAPGARHSRLGPGLREKRDREGAWSAPTRVRTVVSHR